MMTLAGGAAAFETYGTCGSGAGTPIKAPGGGLTYSVSQISFSPGSARHGAVLDAIQMVDAANVPGSFFGAGTGQNSLTKSRNNDGVNNIAAVAIADCDPWDGGFDTEAVTVIRGTKCISGGKIKEADIYLNVCFRQWRANSPYFDVEDSFDAVNLKRPLVHELGHSLGLDHFLFEWPRFSSPTVVEATMNRYTGGGPVLADDVFLENRVFGMSEDDREGMRFLYPDTSESSQGHDLAIQVYWMDAVAVEEGLCGAKLVRPSPNLNDWSIRALEEGLEVDDCPSDMSADPPTEPKQVYAGVDLKILYNVLNLGSVTDVTQVDIKLAEPGNHSNAVVVDTHNPTVAPNFPYRVNREVSIPSDTAPGIYDVVIEVDPNNTISEVDENNNSGVWNQQVEVVWRWQPYEAVEHVLWDAVEQTQICFTPEPSLAPSLFAGLLFLHGVRKKKRNLRAN